MNNVKQTIIDVINRDFKGKAVMGETCSYLTEDGKKCAIGLFIPNGHEAQLSTLEVHSLLEHYPDLWKHMPSKDIVFLMDFQNTHDFELSHEDSLEDQKKTLIKFVENYEM